MKKRILIVEDDDQYRGFLETLLSAEFDVTLASNGEKALSLLSNFSPDLILTDLVMPEMEGIELIRSLKAQNNTALIMVMSGGNRGDASSYLKAASLLGAIKTFKKPIDNDELLSAIRTELSAR